MKSLAAALLLFALPELILGQTTTATFDTDPHWDSFNNHLPPKHIPTVTQHFGYDPASPNQTPPAVRLYTSISTTCDSLLPILLNNPISSLTTTHAHFSYPPL